MVPRKAPEGSRITCETSKSLLPSTDAAVLPDGERTSRTLGRLRLACREQQSYQQDADKLAHLLRFSTVDLAPQARNTRSGGASAGSLGEIEAS
jgi:hypothetical protein